MSKTFYSSYLAAVSLTTCLLGMTACSKSDTPANTQNTELAAKNEPAAENKSPQLETKTAPEVKVAANAKAKTSPAKKATNSISLFDGKSLGKWKSVEFGGEGEVFINDDKNLEFDFGAMMTGVVLKDKTPPATSNYEISLEVMKLSGNDFFLGLTFPVKDSHCSFIAGGWGGGIIGLSSIDSLDASENETINIEGFEDNRWYKIKVRVTDAKIEVWLDDKQFVDLELEDKKIGVRPGDIELCIPLGICAFQTRAQYRNIVWTNLPKPANQ